MHVGSWEGVILGGSEFHKRRWRSRDPLPSRAPAMLQLCSYNISVIAPSPKGMIFQWGMRHFSGRGNDQDLNTFCFTVLVSYTVLHNFLDFPAGVVPVTTVTEEDEEALKSYKGYHHDWYDKLLVKVCSCLALRCLCCHPPCLDFGCQAGSFFVFPWTGYLWSCGAALGGSVCGFAMGRGALPSVHEGGGETDPTKAKASVNNVHTAAHRMKKATLLLSASICFNP